MDAAGSGAEVAQQVKAQEYRPSRMEAYDAMLLVHEANKEQGERTIARIAQQVPKGKQDFAGNINGVGYKQSMDNPAKFPFSLIPPTAVRWIARVLGFGARKYARGQWMAGMSFSEIISGVRRHIDAWEAGEDMDPESGEPHLAHAMCGLSFLSWFISGPDAEQYRKFDDRLFVGAQRLRERTDA